MEDFYYAGGLPAVIARARRAWHAAQRCADRQRPDHVGEHRATRPATTAKSSAPFDKPLLAERRHRRAARQSRPDGAVLKPSAATPAADEASRPGGGVRDHRGLTSAASTIPTSTSTRMRDGAEELRPASGYPGMAEVGNMALPPKLLQAGHHRHGAHLRRAHERHRLRHGGAARLRPKPRSAARWRW